MRYTFLLLVLATRGYAQTGQVPFTGTLSQSGGGFSSSGSGFGGGGVEFSLNIPNVTTANNKVPAGMVAVVTMVAMRCSISSTTTGFLPEIYVISSSGSVEYPLVPTKIGTVTDSGGVNVVTAYVVSQQVEIPVSGGSSITGGGLMLLPAGVGAAAGSCNGTVAGYVQSAPDTALRREHGSRFGTLAGAAAPR
jgi:hypothetical protein